MLRVTTSRSVEQAKRYYTEGLSREDYYTEGLEIVGTWGGKSAELLELSGTVERRAFHNLCEGKHPTNGSKLIQRLKDNRRVGFDFTFDVPKSVSVVCALTGDHRIIDAFRQSIQETMREIQQDSMTRVRKGGKNQDRHTGNMIWSEFVHFTARPVDGIPDPQLHCHIWCPNISYDAEENAWKALQLGKIRKDLPYHQAACDARLAKRLKVLGYGVERNGRSWTLVGVPKRVVDTFSRRTKQIEAEAKRRGIQDPDRKAELGAKTRLSKRNDIPYPELVEAWRGRVSSQDLEELMAAWGNKGHLDPVTKSDALNHAIEHCFDRVSVLSERRFLAEMLKFGVGSLLPDELADVFNHPEIIRGEIDGQSFCTTRSILEHENRMISYVMNGRGSCKPLKVDEHEFRFAYLNEQQRAAVKEVLTSQDRVISISGRAGTGKTSLMREVKLAIEEEGKHLFAFAPSADASRVVQREAGFDGANTVASLLHNERHHESLAGQVVWVDEAGQIPHKDMAQLVELAHEHRFRLVLTHDTRQHGPVAEGDAIRVLEQRAGMRSVMVEEIVRQRGEYKAICDQLAKGDTIEAFDRLEELGWIREDQTGERYKQIASDFISYTASGERVLVVSPTHAEGEQVTQEIREGLKAKHKIGKDERSMTSLRDLSWSPGEKRDALRYEEGMVVQFHRNAPNGIRAGRQYNVVRVNRAFGGIVTIADQTGEEKTLPISKAQRFQVYKPRQIEIAEGETIRITRGGKTMEGKRLENGDIRCVKSINEHGDLILDNHWVIPRDYGHVTHGYCTTSHAAQGKTVDRVLIAVGSQSFTAADAKQFYVSVTRGKKNAVIYTDNCEELKRVVARDRSRVSAGEFLDRIDHKERHLGRIRSHTFLVNRMMTHAKKVGQTMWAHMNNNRTQQTQQQHMYREMRNGP